MDVLESGVPLSSSGYTGVRSKPRFKREANKGKQAERSCLVIIVQITVSRRYFCKNVICIHI